MASILITGCNSGLGRKIANAIMDLNFVYVLGVDKDDVSMACDQYFKCNLENPKDISAIAKEILSLDVLINCAGVNEIAWLEDLTTTQFDKLMNVNARAIYLMAQAFLPALIRSKGTILNIISNASHMPMTASLAYNASKGAAHIMTLQLARELTRKYGITVFGISPNKLAGTGMSKYIESRVPEVRGWTKEEADEYQQSSLLCGETDPAVLAEFIAYLLQSKRNHRYLSGCVLGYGA